MKKVLVGLTAKKGKGWESKLKEIEEYKIKEFALFIEEIEKKQRNRLYGRLLRLKNKQSVKIPLVHIRHDSDKKELAFLKKNFKTRYFTIHEDGFKRLKKLGGFYKNLYLEMDFNNFIPEKVNVSKIGGFCIDLSHFKLEEENWTKEFEYILKRRKSKYFKCNHLNGYSFELKKHLHTIKNIKDFEYLKTLPKFVFGEIIALEMYNSIKEQMKYKKYLESSIGL